MKKDGKYVGTNNLFSALLVFVYVLCVFFLEAMTVSLDAALSAVILVAMYVIFGALLFYATRVGERKQIRRFSLSILLLMVLPGAYMVLAAFAPGLPFAAEITGSVMGKLGYVMLGYGLPYTFLSGLQEPPESPEEKRASTIFEEGISSEKLKKEPEALISEEKFESSAEGEKDK